LATLRRFARAMGYSSGSQYETSRNGSITGTGNATHWNH
jgi:hypothetical protein